MYLCERCKKECIEKFASGRFCSLFCAHSRKHTILTKEKISSSIRNCEAYKNGTLSKRGNRVQRITKQCQSCNRDFVVCVSSSLQKFCSLNCSYKNPNIGGYRENSGRSKSGWYGEFYCGSSWELAFLLWARDHELPIKRCITKYPYEFEGMKRTYLPDFVINDFVIEIKGYDTQQVHAKIEQCSANLIVLRKNDLQPVFDYVKNKYGHDFIRLFEGNPHNNKKKMCKVCNLPSRNIFCSRKCSADGNRELRHKT